MDDTRWRNILSLPGVEAVSKPGGASLPVRPGVRRLSGNDLLFSMGNRVPAGKHHLEEIRTLATRLESRRSPRQVGSIRCTADSPKLGASQRCGCNSAFAGVARGGLRPVSRRSLPALMLELKASAELHLPVQALDYWIP